MVRHCDVVIIGAGPSGSAAAYWLASAGYDVVVVEKKSFPREKTCGDGITPRAVVQLEAMGLGSLLEGHHPVDGLRLVADKKSLELEWPKHPTFGDKGYVITRHDLDVEVANNAVKAGVELWQHCEAKTPLFDDAGLLRGVEVENKDNEEHREVRGKYVIISDGANSRIGRALGTMRDKNYPLGLAIRGYFNSPRHDDRFMEGFLDLRDDDGSALPGYGWIFPVGDGRVNVGLGVLSTSARFKAVNTTKLMETFVRQTDESWGINPDSACSIPTGGKLPMALSVGPSSGATYLVTGDATGAINPFNGEGIAYAYETGHMAAEILIEALATSNDRVLNTYRTRLDDEYGLYYRVGRMFVKAIGQPKLMAMFTRIGIENRTLMDWIVRIMNNSLRPGERKPAELAYAALSNLVRVTGR